MGGNLFEAGGAYNAGPGSVSRWRASQPDDPLLFVESIPVSETRDYVKRLMEYHWMYRHRLGENAPSLEQTASGQWPVYSTAYQATRWRPRHSLKQPPAIVSDASN